VSLFFSIENLVIFYRVKNAPRDTHAFAEENGKVIDSD